MAQEVRMLGTGNAFMPYGRYHSFAMIDGKHIIDCHLLQWRVYVGQKFL